jgi:hypothetical protein
VCDYYGDIKGYKWAEYVARMELKLQVYKRLTGVNKRESGLIEMRQRLKGTKIDLIVVKLST